MKTFHLRDLPRYLAWEEERAAHGQWDSIAGRLLGVWADQEAARAFLLGKRLDYGLGFYADSDSLRTRWVKGGLIEMDFTARGLFAEKFKRTEFTEINGMSIEDVAINATGYSYPDRWSRAEVEIPTPVIEVVACTDIEPDFTKAGLAISGVPFWLAKTGGLLPNTVPNPWTPGTGQAYTVHYPSGWVMKIQPGDSISRGLSTTFERLHITTYRAEWRHKITP